MKKTQMPVSVKRPWETRETLWAAIRRLKSFTLSDLYLETDLDKSTVGLYMRNLVKAGILTMTKQAESEKKQDSAGRYVAGNLYELVKDSIEPPRVRKDGTEVTQGTGRMNMWRSMKLLKRFTLADLRACSSTTKQQVAAEEAETYLRFMVAAGYIKKLDTKSIERATFALVNWTGPKAPMIQRIKQVWDPNLKEVTWPKEPSDEKDK